MKVSTTFLYPLLILIGFTGMVRGQAVVPGDIIITEFMADPAATTDSNGEYVELYNKRSVAINIDGFILKDDGNNSHTVDNGGTLNIPAESFIVLAKSTVPGFTPDYTYNTGGSFSLTNGGDQIVLTNASGTEIAMVNYSSSATGKSSELDALSSVNNNGTASGSSYSDSESEIGNGDSGSPGSAGKTRLSENPSVRFSESGATVNESDGTINIKVLIEDPDGTAVDADVVFQQTISTAEAADFTSSTTKTVSFGSATSDGEVQNASFTLDNDSDYEGTENSEFKLENISTSGAATISGQTEYRLTIEDNETPNVVINEINADPSTDASGNGGGATSDDEFVEIVNAEPVSIDIGGWTISDAGSVVYTFTEHTILPANGVAVVFADAGFSGSFGGAIVQGTASLSLNNSSETVTLKNTSGTTIDTHTYGSEGDDDQSLVRDPEITGSFVKHSSATGAGGAVVSPGTKINGSLFTTSLVIEGNTGWRMLSAPVENMPISELTDDTPIQGFGDGHVKNFYDGYDGTSFTAPGDLSGNLSSGKGFILYFYNNMSTGSATLPVIIDIGSNSEPSSDVNISLHSAGNGWNLLGNPYQTAFDVTTITPTGGSLASAVTQIWSDENESYILSSANNDKVASGQGFFLQNSDATSVDLPTLGKATGTRFYKQDQQKAFIQLALISENAKGQGVQRDLSTMLYFHEEAHSEWDQWDAEKIYPLKSNFSILNIISNNGQKIKAQDSRPFEGGGSEAFSLNIESQNVKPGQTIEWNSSFGIPEAWTLTFIDHKTGAEIIMDGNFSYKFTQDDISYIETSSSKLSKSLTPPKANNDPRFSVVVNKGTASNTEPFNRPQEFKLHQNYPNPFNPTTSIKYSIAEQGEVTLSIYNVLGQRVETVVNEARSPGRYQVSWDASDVASGIYYYQLKTGGSVVTRQMILIK